MVPSDLPNDSASPALESFEERSKKTFQLDSLKTWIDVYARRKWILLRSIFYVVREMTSISILSTDSVLPCSNLPKSRTSVPME
jgi:hypothetical protein